MFCDHGSVIRGFFIGFGAAGLALGTASVRPVAAQTGSDLGVREQTVRAALDRIARWNPRYNAFISVNPAIVERARALDAAVNDTEANGAEVGPLDRRTIAVKANLDVEGFPANAGVRNPGRDVTSSGNAFAVAAVSSAGGLVVGITNMDSWARGTKTVSEFGSTGNAFDPKRSPFGSSGGSAVAVATGMVDMALGTDTCGSIRYPASANGIFGLRPTIGVVSRTGLVPLSPTQDVVGPMARTVEDLRTLFSVLTVYDPADPAMVAQPPAVPRAGSKRVGVLRGFGSVNQSEDAPLGRLRAAGYKVVDVDGRALQVSSVIEDEFEPARSLWRRNLASWDVSGSVKDQPAYRQRLVLQARLRNQLSGLLVSHDIDALIYPTTSAPSGLRGARQVTANCGLSANSGLPALAVPGPLKRGFPQIGVDLLGRAFDEGTLFEVAVAATPVLGTPTIR
jgi:amidase